jgi:dTDP-4-amino-4,6-dideoxygalactose transaminase
MIDVRDRVELLKTFESGEWWFGDRVANFEEAFARFQSAKHCITCSTGTIGLEIMMQAAGIKPGDEVIVPAFTFVATATAVARMGGKVVFADVDDSWCMDPDLVEPLITERTRAIMPVHFGGRVADMDKFTDLASKHGLQLFEDACHSWGSQWKGKGTGALGKAGVFSFQMFKNLSAAEGGAIVTDDDDFADLCRSIVNCGRAKDSPWYHHSIMGTNARITELQGSILGTQLEKLGGQTDKRIENAKILDAGLSDIEGLTLQRGDSRVSRRGYHLYPLRIDAAQFGCTRLQFIKAAQAEGLPISERFYTEPVYRQPVFYDDPSDDYREVCCPVSEDLAWRSAMWLGHTLLLGSKEDMQHIVEIVQKVKRNASDIPAVD